MRHILRSSKIYFTSLQLTNVRCFAGRQELRLTDAEGRIARWTLVLGENGVGKTTLLRCLARMRPVPATSANSNEPDEVQPELLAEQSNDVLDSFIRCGENIQLELRAELSNGVSLGSKVREPRRRLLSCVSLHRKRGELEDSSAAGSSTDVSLAREPFILSYGAARHMGSQNLDSIDLVDTTASLFEHDIQLYDAEEILVQLDYSAIKRQDSRVVNLLDRVKQALADILPDVARPDDIMILGPRVPGDTKEASGVRVRTAYGTVPIGELSLGSQTALALAVDIAWRLFQRYPKEPNPLSQPAIALIDEIDLHLHPRWQRDIRSHFICHFPNVQFIVTAHSPLMAQAALDANIIVLKQIEDHVEIENDPVVVDEWRVDQVLTSELFGLSTARSLAVEKLLLERKRLLEKPKRTLEEAQQLKRLDKTLSALPTAELPDDQRALDIIRRAASLIEPDS